MVDLKTIFAGADGTSPVLRQQDCGYVVGREGAAVGGDARASIVGASAPKLFQSLGIALLPTLQGLAHFLAVLLSPALYRVAVPGRVLRAALTRHAGVVVVGISRVPFAAPFHAALDANPVRYPALVVTVFAWMARRIVAFSALSRCRARRMVWPLGLAAHRGLAGARRASTADDGPLGEVSFATRLAGEVKALASGYRGRALRACSHILIVIEDGVKGHQFHAR